MLATKFPHKIFHKPFRVKVYYCCRCINLLHGDEILDIVVMEKSRK